MIRQILRKRKDVQLGTDIFVFGPGDVAASWDPAQTDAGATYPTIYEGLKNDNGAVNFQINLTDNVQEGKWYFEVNTVVVIGSDFITLVGQDAYPVGTANTVAYIFGTSQSGGIRHYTPGWGTIANDDVLMLAIDLDDNKIWTGKNGSWGAFGGVPAEGVNPQASWTTPPTGFLFRYRSNGTGIGNIILHTKPEHFIYDVPFGFHPGLYIDN